VVAHRHRPRALLAATVAATVVAFMMGGSAAAIGVWMCAVLGGMVGDVKRRGRGRATIVLHAAVVGPLLALLADGTLLVFSETRILALDAARNSAHGTAELLAPIWGLGPAAAELDRLTATAVQYWVISVAVVVIAAVFAGTWFSWVAIGAVLERLTWVAADDHLDAALQPGAPEPVPVTLTDVHLRYPASSQEALSGVDLTVALEEFLAVVGRNGSGKSTLVRILAGAPPTAGAIERAGSVGLGQPGGTAVVLQRPESQVLGVLVADDVVWGLPAGADVDVAGLLDDVGLSGMGERETTTLSGGELQRLAVAAALARRPRLLISDESTSMADEASRDAVVELLAGLPGRHGVTVVHVTHQESEAAGADRVLHLQAGRVVDHPVQWTAEVPHRHRRRPPDPVRRPSSSSSMWIIATRRAHRGAARPARTAAHRPRG